MAKVITGTVNVAEYTAYTDDVIADDALFDISADARLVLTGDDQFNDDTITGGGQLRVRGPLAIDGLTIEATASLVNAATVTQTGDVTLGVAGDDAAGIRNLTGATWNAVGSVAISQTGANSRFVNLGLFAQSGADDTVTVEADFLSRGAVEAEGTIDFQGASTRLFGSLSAGAVNADDLFVDGADISTTGTLNAQNLIVRGDVQITSANDLGAFVAGFYNTNLQLQSGARLELNDERSVILENVNGSGEVDLNNTTRLLAYVNSMDLTGNVKLVNAGTLSPGPLYIYSAAYLTFNMTPKAGGKVEIDNLAGATWIDGNSETTFNGDGTSSAFFHNFGTFEEAGGFGSTLGTYFNIDVVNDGLITSGDAPTNASQTYNGIVFDDSVTGAGTIDVGLNAVTFNAAVGAGQTVAFTSVPEGRTQSPTLTLTDLQDFAATISGFAQEAAASDQIIINGGWQFQSYTPDAVGLSGELIFSNGAQTTSVALVGDYDPADFDAAVSGSQTTITYAGPPTSTIEIDPYTVYRDDVVLSDTLIDLHAGARLVLLGDDKLVNDTLALAGQLRVLGPLRVNGLTLESSVSLVNAATVTQTGLVTLGASANDAVTIRNLSGAAWELGDASEISQKGEGSSFVNLGLVQEDSPADHSSISASFYNRGTLDVEGSLDFTGATTRLLGTVQGAGQITADFAAFVSTSVFVAAVTATRARLIGDVSFSSTNVNATNFTLANATVDFSGSYTLGFGAVVGSGEIDFQGTASLSALYLDGAVSLVNAGTLTFYTTSNVVMAGGGTVEFRNLAGATWRTIEGSSTDYTTVAGTNGLFDNAGSYFENGNGVFDITVNNDGEIGEGRTYIGPEISNYSFGNLTFNKAITGSGTVLVDSKVATNAAVAAGQTFEFGGGIPFINPDVLTIGDLADFNGVISDFQGQIDNAIDVASDAWTYEGASLNPNGSGASLMFSDNGQEKALNFTGQYDPSKFLVSSNDAGLRITYSS